MYQQVSDKVILAGCSKKPRCKASEVLRSETYSIVRRSEEGRGERSRWAFFSSLLKKHLQPEVYVLRVKDIVLAGKPVPVCKGYAQGDGEFLFGKRGDG